MTNHDSAIGRLARPLSGPAALYALLLAGAVAVYGAANAVVPVARELRTTLGAGGGDAALFLAPFAAGFAIGAVAWFALARHRPPALVLPTALGLVAVGGLAMAAVPNPSWAVAARVLAGIGAAGYPAAAQALISTTVPAAHRGRYIGGFIMAVVGGSFAGQLAAGALAAPTTARTAVALVAGAVPALIGGALALALAGRRGGAPAGGGRTPLPTAHLLAQQWPVLLVAFATFGGYWLAMSRLPEVLRGERFTLSAAATGAMLSLGAAGIAVAWLAGRLIDRRGQRLPATVLATVGLLGLALTLPPAVPLWSFALGMGLFLACYWGLVPVMSAEAAARSTAADRQPALMAMYAGMWIGAAVAPLAGTAIAGWGAIGTAIIAAWAVAATLCTARFTATRAATPLTVATSTAQGGP